MGEPSAAQPYHAEQMNLILLQSDEVDRPARVELADIRAAHLINVLRVAPGHEVRVGIVDGPRGLATVKSIAGGRVELACSFETAVPPPPRVDLLLALPRPKVMRRLWAQLAALGVGQIILTNAERVERNYFDTHVLTPECYRPLLIEGLQQARDTRLPRVSIHRQFKILVEDELDALFSTGRRLVADCVPGAPARTLSESAAEHVLLAVGPEGGWNDFERQLLAAHQFQPISLGSRALRSDTACIALVAVVTALTS